jgi:hypothetical protein
VEAAKRIALKKEMKNPHLPAATCKLDEGKKPHPSNYEAASSQRKSS